jgi:putative membrane protein
MNRVAFGVAAFAAAATLACSNGTQSPANNQNPNATVGTSGQTQQVSNDVRDFVQKAAMTNMAEIQLGNLAEQKAQSPQVKDFAQMMVRDHTKANDDLKQIAKAQNIDLPTQLDDEHQDLRQKLQGLSGADFDREYMDAMVDGHQDAVDMLKDHADDLGKTQPNAPVGTSGSTSARVAADQWAANTLPAVQGHLDRAKQIKERLENNTTDQ